MKYKSVVPLNSAPDVPRVPIARIRPESLQFLQSIGIYEWLTPAEMKRELELRLQLMNVAQRTEALKKISELLNGL